MISRRDIGIAWSLRLVLAGLAVAMRVVRSRSPAQTLLPGGFFDNLAVSGTGKAVVEADTLAYDADADVITAEGDVVMSYERLRPSRRPHRLPPARPARSQPTGNVEVIDAARHALHRRRRRRHRQLPEGVRPVADADHRRRQHDHGRRRRLRLRARDHPHQRDLLALRALHRQQGAPDRLAGAGRQDGLCPRQGNDRGSSSPRSSSSASRWRGCRGSRSPIRASRALSGFRLPELRLLGADGRCGQRSLFLGTRRRHRRPLHAAPDVAAGCALCGRGHAPLHARRRRRQGVGPLPARSRRLRQHGRRPRLARRDPDLGPVHALCQLGRRLVVHDVHRRRLSARLPT